MKFLRSRVEQLADHLRECVARGELASPLPSIRDWSAKLGVAHGTLERALKILKRDGLVRAQPRKGIHLTRRTSVRNRLRQPPQVRWLVYGRRYQDMSSMAEIFAALGQRLSPHGIRLSLELCNSSRLRAIHAEGQLNYQMLVLPSFSKEFQELFATFERSALIVGRPFPGVRLSHISADVPGAIWHAIWMLARRGFSRVSLVISERSNQPIDEEFRRICAQPTRPLHGDVIRLPEDLHEQNLAVGHLVSRVTGRHAFICNSPIPTGLLMMAMMKRGLNVPDQVDVVAMNATSSEVRTFPLATCYPYPMERFSKALCQAAVHYFEHGVLPPLHLEIPLRMVVPPR